MRQKLFEKNCVLMKEYGLVQTKKTPNAELKLSKVIEKIDARLNSVTLARQKAIEKGDAEGNFILLEAAMQLRLLRNDFLEMANGAPKKTEK